jgi:hypothetical protein
MVMQRHFPAIVRGGARAIPSFGSDSWRPVVCEIHFCREFAI